MRGESTLSSYAGGKNLEYGVFAEPSKGLFRLLHVPSYVRYLLCGSHAILMLDHLHGVQDLEVFNYYKFDYYLNLIYIF